MVPADEVDDLVQKDLPKAIQLIKEMNENAVQVAHLVDDMLDRVKRGELSTAKGLSFLEVKYHMLLSYLINLTYVVLRKCTGEPIEADPAIDRLVELRTVLEKIRPIDTKLKYQVDKLVKAAVTGATAQNDPTNYKPNPDNMISQFDDSDASEDDSIEEKKKETDKKSVYVPPKLAAVPYDPEGIEDDNRRQSETSRKRSLSSALLQELKEEYLDAPVEVGHGSGKDTQTARHNIARKEYEETYFTRLPVTKSERHQQRRTTTVGTLGEELTRFEGTSSRSFTGSGKKKRKIKGKIKKNFKKRRLM